MNCRVFTRICCGVWRSPIATRSGRSTSPISQCRKAFCIRRYPTAVIDLHSRYVVGWDISNTLDAASSLRVLVQAIDDYGKPQIVNSDQGSQFTCKLWVEYLQSQDIRISMDSKGRAIDNVFIERLWRSLKYEYVYLSPAEDAKQLFEGLVRYFQYYNYRRLHQGIGRIKPAELYRPLQRYRLVA